MTEAISNYEENSLPQLFLYGNAKFDDIDAGDIIILATDALCEWMMKLNESGKPIWKTIADLNNQDQFKLMIETARRELDSGRRIKDDDVALIVISIGEQSPEFLDDTWVYEPGISLPNSVKPDGTSVFDALISGGVVAAPSQIEFQQEAEAKPQSNLIRFDAPNQTLPELSDNSISKILMVPPYVVLMILSTALVIAICLRIPDFIWSCNTSRAMSAHANTTSQKQILKVSGQTFAAPPHWGKEKNCEKPIKVDGR